jgi:hypothetical protein
MDSKGSPSMEQHIPLLHLCDVDDDSDVEVDWALYKLTT